MKECIYIKIQIENGQDLEDLEEFSDKFQSRKKLFWLTTQSKLLSEVKI